MSKLCNFVGRGHHIPLPLPLEKRSEVCYTCICEFPNRGIIGHDMACRPYEALGVPLQASSAMPAQPFIRNSPTYYVSKFDCVPLSVYLMYLLLPS